MMEKPIFRPAVAADVDAAEGIYNAILDGYDRGEPNYTNWARGVYPIRQDAQDALEAGSLYVAECEGRVAACANLNHEQLPEYAQIKWSMEAQGDEVLVIHTLCVHPACAGQGIARGFVAYAEELGRNMGCKTLRLDTYEGNLPATALYRRLGFADLGLAEFLFQGVIRENLRCFDKAL